MNYKELKWPGVSKVTGRSSTIRGQFIKAIIPHLYATDTQYLECLAVLGQDPTDLSCSYCGIRATEWDHFRPIVENKWPSGYITDIYNLVPACGKCNQSKSGKKWDAWITGSARHVPKTGIEQEQRINRLRAFEEWSNNLTYRLSDSFLKSPELRHYMEKCEDLINSFSAYKGTSDLLRSQVERMLEERKG